MRSLSFPQVGDETLAIRMSGEVTFLPDPNEEFSFDFSATLEADLIVVRRDNLVMILAHLAPGVFGPASLDSSETEQIVRAGVTKLETL